jgi:hypothetical protein
MRASPTVALMASQMGTIMSPALSRRETPEAPGYISICLNIATFSSTRIFQRPTKDQGKGFRNPHYYVTAAVLYASETLGDADAYLVTVLDMTNQHIRADPDHISGSAFR